MNEKTDPSSLSGIRMRCAMNGFKQLLIADKHMPGIHQTRAVVASLPDCYKELSLFDDSWKFWFTSGVKTIPQRNTLKQLDRIAQAVQQERGLEIEIPADFFLILVRGGLMTNLSQATKAKDTWSICLSRAAHYRPVSALHLHLDAVETAANHNDMHGIPWGAISALAANRIASIIAKRWSPREGNIYEELESDFSIAYQAASDSEKDEIRQAC